MYFVSQGKHPVDLFEKLCSDLSRRPGALKNLEEISHKVGPAKLSLGRIKQVVSRPAIRDQDASEYLAKHLLNDLGPAAESDGEDHHTRRDGCPQSHAFFEHTFYLVSSKCITGCSRMKRLISSTVSSIASLTRHSILETVPRRSSSISTMFRLLR